MQHNRDSSSCSGLRLARHVYSCRAGEHVVLLDLKQGRYLGIDGSESDELAALIEGWPKRLREELAGSRTSVDTSGLTARSELIEEMIDAGVLVRDSPAIEVSPISIAPPETALIDGYVDITYECRLRDVARFAAASLTARTLLRSRSVDSIAARVRARRLRAVSLRRGDSDRGSDGEIAEMRIRVAMFERLRPLLFSTCNACMYHSFALSEFLARYRLWPQWVFGVATMPFGAHCWLQQGPVVINDTPDNVRRFTPIMVV